MDSPSRRRSPSGAPGSRCAAGSTVAAGVDRLDQLRVGHHPRGAVGADAEQGCVRRALAGRDDRTAAGRLAHQAPTSGCSPRTVPRVTEVAVLDEPLDDLPPAADTVTRSRRLATADGGAGGEEVEPRRPRGEVEGALDRRNDSARWAWSRFRSARRAWREARASSSCSGPLKARSHPLQRALRDAGQGAAGGFAEDAGDAQVLWSPGQVPAHGGGDLAHDAAQHLGALWMTSVAVGDDAGAGSCTETERARRPRWPTAGAMSGVRKAPATLSGTRRALGGASAKAASCSSLPATTIGRGRCRWPLSGPASRWRASTSSRSPPSTAVMPVGLVPAAAALALPRSEHHGLLGGDDARPGGGGQLADAVARDRGDLAQGVRGVRNSSSAAIRPVATSSGWAILVSRIVSASPRCLVGEVDLRDGGEPLHPGREGRVLEPGLEESGSLGTSGATMTTRVPLCRVGGPRARPARTNLSR